MESALGPSVRLSPAGRVRAAWAAAQALSLDVAVGGACGGALAASFTAARPPGATWLVLPAAIWLVYTADHLLDGARLGSRARSARHRLHARRPAPLVAAAAAVALLGLAVAVASLPPEVVAFGLALGVAIAGYLALAQGLGASWLPKEVAAAALYAAGIWGAPVLLAHELGARVALAFALHALGAGLNLATYGLFERDDDARDGSRSLAGTLGGARLRHGILVASALGAAVAVAAAVLSGPDMRAGFAVLAILVAFPGSMLVLETRFRPAERYRLWGDLVFVLGALPLWLARVPR